VKKIGALAADPTRNEVQKHDAARQVAEKVVGVMERSHTALNRIVAALDAEAQAEVDKVFALPSHRGGIHDAMRNRFGEMAKRETGLTEIRAIVAKDREAAAVIVNTPAWLLGIAEEAHGGIMGDTIKRFAPNAAIAVAKSQRLEEVAAKYPKAIAGVRRSFFNAAIADKAKNRVEV
jgi:Arc/MetJ family transcription regulator